MVLWIAMAVLAAAACLPLLLPLGGSRRVARSAAAPAMAIYRDQLDEVDRDVSRGVIADSEAAGARTEIARRLIREGETVETSAAPAEWPRLRRPKPGARRTRKRGSCKKHLLH